MKIPRRRAGNPLQHFAWRSTWTEEPGRQQFIESQRVGHDWVTKHTYTPLWRTLANTSSSTPNRPLSSHVCFLYILSRCQPFLLKHFFSVTDCRFFSAQNRTPLHRLEDINFSPQSLYLLPMSKLYSEYIMYWYLKIQQKKSNRKGIHLSCLLHIQLRTLHVIPHIHPCKQVSCDFS